MALSSPVLVPAVCICAGVGLCYLATGVNSADDLTNEYYILAALPSIATSFTPVGVSSKVTALVGENLLKKVTWSTGNAIYQKTEQLSVKKFIDETIENQFEGYSYNALLNSLGFYKN